MTTDLVTDLIIVGAGAAGLAAARAAAARGLRVVLLEAKTRTGGRAYTDSGRFGVPVDYGCHWLHAADVNPFTALADRYGFDYRRLQARQLLYRPGDGRVGGPAASADYDAYCQRCWQAVETAGARGYDVAIAEVVDRDSRWYPLFSSLCAGLNGNEPESCSTLDWYRYRETGRNWPVADGFGALVVRYGREVPVRLGTRVETVDWRRDEVRVGTGRGELRARAVLLTVSTGVLAAPALRFLPALPAAKRQAIAALAPGQADKVILQFDRDVFGVPDTSYLRLDNGSREVFAFQLRPFGRELAIGSAAGAFAAALARAGGEEALALALSQLQCAFGDAPARALIRGEVTGWGADPDFLGAYSIALPGGASQRAVLAEPLNERLFFAGEATSIDAYGTAHGAYASGVAAVAQITAALAARG